MQTGVLPTRNVGQKDPEPHSALLGISLPFETLKLLNLEEHSNPFICLQVAAQDPALFNTFSSISPALKGYKGASRPEGGLWNYSL